MNVALRPQPDALNLLSLCTGGGGLDRAVELAIPSARTVVCVERESFSVANLVAQMQDGVMAPAAVWSDARTFNGRPWRGLVDGVIGGIPCQPHSLAGKRLGREDERDLWSVARRIFVQSGAWFILIENVGGMLSSGGAERVRRDLLRMGCAIEGGRFTALEVGAWQERERFFILGVADAAFVARNDGRQPGAGGSGELQAGGHGFGVANAEGGPGWAEQQSSGAGGGWRGPPGGGAELADPDQPELQGQPSAGQLGVDECDAGPGVEPGSQHLADGDGDGPAADGRDDGQERGLSEAEGRPDHGSALPGRGCGPLAHAGHAGHAGLQGCGPPGDRPGERPAPERGGGDVGRPGGGRQLRDDGRRPDQEPSDGCVHVVDPVGGGHDGWQGGEDESPQRRAAVEWAGEGPLFAPGPGDVDAWRAIAERYPERLPAVSRHDLFRIEIRAAWLAAHGDPSARPGQAWGDSPASSWLDPQGPYGLRAAVVQSIAESTLRGRSDGVAARIDELRMLGNGVVDLEGAYALRTLATRLARRSAGATELVRLMGEPE